MTLYEKVETLCKQNGINISNLGEALGIKVDKSTISHWKKGAVPRASTVKAIADFFDVTVDYLTNGSATVETAFNTVNGNNNIIGNGNTVGASLTEHQKVLLELFDQMDIVKQAQLLVYAKELVKK